MYYMKIKGGCSELKLSCHAFMEEILDALMAAKRHMVKVISHIIVALSYCQPQLIIYWIVCNLLKATTKIMMSNSHT